MSTQSTSERSTRHATFSIERMYPASPARVFAAWASKEAKAKWFFCDESWQPRVHELDFRVGGHERHETGPAGGQVHAFDGVYHDIVPDRRIVYSYAMRLGERRISVSLTTIDIEPAGSGTRFVFTEQSVFLDGYDDLAGREEGTGIGLDNLGAALRAERDAA
jgi:uncharacterized protein YndB with AHSA1/START domain